MDNGDDGKMINERYDEFVHWVVEREKCRKGRENNLPKPWTEDKHIANYRYCNVNRNDDTVTKWIFKNVIANHDDSPYLWFNLVIARFLNNPNSLRELEFIEQWDPEQFMWTLDKLQVEGEKIFNGAYMIHAKTKGVPKHHYLGECIFTPMWEARDTVPGINMFGYTPLCAEWDAWLRGFYGMGGFMRNQIITDMKYAPSLLMGAGDRGAYIQPGPGTKKGLNILNGRDMASQKGNYFLELDVLRAVLKSDTRLRGIKSYWDDLNNVSNCCCEFSKYSKLLMGLGRPKAKYPGSVK